MLITDNSLDFIQQQVIYLAGCYPNINWDVDTTASSWLIALVEIKATEEEFNYAIHQTVNDGVEEWKVNIALITNNILNKRKYEKIKTNSKEYLKQINETPTMTKEKLQKWFKYAEEKGLKLGLVEDEKKV